MQPSKAGAPTLAFLATRYNRDLGYVGGLLILTPNGRPVEFHCSLPVRPSRAQEILFGSSIDEFICSDVVGKALIARMKNTPAMIFTDIAPMLLLRMSMEVPFAFLEFESSDLPRRFEKPCRARCHLRTAEIVGHSIQVLESTDDDAAILRCWNGIHISMDLHEPFLRIEEALSEANPIAKAA